MSKKTIETTGKLILFKRVCHPQNCSKNINHISYISSNKRITYMSKIIQSAVTKLINNEITKLRIARSILLQV